MKQLSKAIRLALVAVLLVGINGTAHAGNLGVGLHYLHNLGDLKATDASDLSWDQDSFSLLVSAQRDIAMLRLEGALEYIFNYVGTDEAMWQPSAWLLLGGLVYGGAGIGIGYTDGDWQNDPFYALRGGVNIGLAGFGLDIYASYRFQNDDELKNLTGDDLDSLTFAAVARFGL